MLGSNYNWSCYTRCQPPPPCQLNWLPSPCVCTTATTPPETNPEEPPEEPAE
jgi:hypothetical protein